MMNASFPSTHTACVRRTQHISSFPYHSNYNCLTLTVALLLVLNGLQLQAQFTSNAGGAWTTPAVGAVWSAGPAGQYPGSQPGNGSVTINAGGALTYTDCNTPPHPIASLSTFVINGMGPVTFQGAGTMTIGGAVTINTPLIIDNGLTVVFTGTVNISATGSITVSNGARAQFHSSVSGAIADAIVSQSGGVAEFLMPAAVSGTGIISGIGSGVVAFSSGVLNGAVFDPPFTGTLRLNGNLTCNGTILLDGGALLDLGANTLTIGNNSRLDFSSLANPGITGTGRIAGSGSTSTFAISNTNVNGGIFPAANLLPSFDGTVMMEAPTAFAMTLNANLVLSPNGSLLINMANRINTGIYGITIASPNPNALVVNGDLVLQTGGRLVMNTPAPNAVSGAAGAIVSNANTTITLGNNWNSNTFPVGSGVFSGISGVLEVNTASVLTLPASSPLAINAGGRLRMVDISRLLVPVPGTLTYAAPSTLEYTAGSNTITGDEFLASMPATVEITKTAGTTFTLNTNKTLLSTGMMRVLTDITLNLNGFSLGMQGGADFARGSIQAMGLPAEGLLFSGTTLAANSRLRLLPPETLGFLTITPSASNQPLNLITNLTLIAPQGLSIGANGIFRVQTNATLTMTAPAALFNSGQLRLDSLTGSRLVIGNNVNVNNVGLLAAASGTTIEIQGGSGTFTPSGNPPQFSPNSTLLYSGTSARSASISEFPATMPGNVVLRNPAGVTLPIALINANGSFALADSAVLVIPASGQLNLNGTTNLSASSDVQGISGTLAFAGSGAINGNLRSSTGLGSLLLDRLNARVVLGTPLTLNGTLICTRGFLVSTSATPVIISNSAPNAVSGGSALSFVDGPLQRQFGPGLTVGQQLTYTFPVGKQNTYLPLWMIFPETGIPAPVVRIEAFTGAHDGSIASSSPPLEPVTSLSRTEYWTSTVVSGIFLRTFMSLSAQSATPTSVVAVAPAINGTYSSRGGTFTLTSPALMLPTVRSTISTTLEGAYAIGNTAPQPRIDRITPNTGGIGTTATLIGTGFNGTTSVRLNVTIGGVLVGVPVRSFAVQSNEQMTIVVDSIPTVSVIPTQATITLAANGGTTTSTLTFAYLPRPVITGLSTTIGGTGTRVTITGRNFSTTASMQVSFGGVVTTATVLSTTALVATVGTGASGAVVVASAGGQATTTSTFTFVPPPSITGFSPAFGARGTIVEIRGANLLSVTDVLFGNTPAERFGIREPGDAIFAVVGSGTTGTITLVWGGGRVTTATVFVHGTTPFILNVSPNSAPAGTPITITGVNLFGITSLTMNNALGSVPIPFIPEMPLPTSTTQTIRAIVPLGTTGGTIQLRAVGGVASSPERFIVEPSLRITTVTPSSGTSGTIVTLTGVNFTTVASISVAGTLVSTFAVVSSTEIIAIVGNTSESGDIRINAINGITTATVRFTNSVVPPQITGVSSTVATIGAPFFIDGRFLTGIQEITIGGAVVPRTNYQALSATRLSIFIPPNATTGSLVVRTLGGTASTTTTITVRQGVFITAFRPPFGAIGTPVRIQGGNFRGVTEVRFGTVPALSYRVESDSVIVAIPAVGSRTAPVFIAGSLGIGESLTPFQILSRTQLDSSALVLLYRATGGDSAWRSRSGWLANDDIGSWQGVTTDFFEGTLRVVSIDLSANGLVGSLPDEALELLTGLRTLNVANNQLTGKFPALGFMRRIETVRLSGNRLSGSLPDTSSVSSFALPLSLRILEASNNQFSGTLPNSLCALSALQELTLAGNRLTGEIPRCIGALSSLTRLNISNNQLSGSLPTELGNLTNLRELLLANNRLSGSLPASLGSTAPNRQAAIQAALRLERLDVSNNQLSGNIPPSFANLRSMQEFNVSTNALTSTSLEAILRGMQNISVLNLANNRFGNNFTDSLPPALRTMTSLVVLNLSNNQFIGSIPALSVGSLREIVLDSNRLTGTVPASIADLPQLRRFSVAGNRLTGLTPTPFYQEALRDVNVANNRLTFLDIEPNLAIPSFIYAPQDSLGTARDTAITLGTRFELQIPSAGGTTNTRYQWTRNGVRITTASDSLPVLVLPMFSIADTGTYRCTVTNRRVPLLTLTTRPIRLGFVRLGPIGSEPRLVFPTNRSTFISTAPQFEWTAVRNATQYEVQVSLQPAFTQLTTTAIITPPDRRDTIQTVIGGLDGRQTYYWRVRGVNPGNEGEWSEVFSFTTAPRGTVVSLSSVDFGRVVIDDIERRQARITNLSEQVITVRDIVLDDPSLEFRVGLDARNLVLAPNQSFAIPVFFAPKAVGQKSARATLQYIAGGRDSSVVYDGLLAGRATPLKILPEGGVNFDTVLVRRPTLTTFSVINRGSQTVRFDSVVITNSGGGAYTIEPSFVSSGLAGVGLAPLDTTQVIMRCTAPSVGRMRGALRVWSRADTVDVPIDGFARMLTGSDVEMSVRLRPSAGSANALPGNRVTLEFLVDAPPATLQRLAGILPLFAFEASVRFNRNVLSLDQSLRQPGLYALRNNRAPSPIETVLFPRFSLAGLSTSLLATITCQAVLGETDQTTLQVESFRWLQPFDPLNYRGRVFVTLSDSTNGRFTTNTCAIDGVKRLVGSSFATQITAARPNPATHETVIGYALRERGLAMLSLYNAAGQHVKTLVHAHHEAGTYEYVFDTSALSTGMYRLVLVAPSSLHSELLVIVR